MEISEFKNLDNYEQAEAKEKLLNQVESIKTGVNNLQARSDRTKIFNQKIDEDLLILETTDELFHVPQAPAAIFSSVNSMPEINQFFILSEEAQDDRTQQRSFNFDLDQSLALRQDCYSGDINGFFDAYGHLENNSSDVTIVNDTLYNLRLRMDENESDFSIEDGFSIGFNDIEKDNILSFKRDYTISGYTVNYIVEGKMNS
jgi:alpha-N-acetylglucosamine transferase